jgi:hypothetical protein
MDHKFGHDKQHDAFDALRRTWHAGQHQMADVLRHVVLIVGDVNLGAEHFYLPSGCGLARERTAAKSEPAFGLVRFMVLVHLVLMSLAANLHLSSSLPATSSASIASSVKHWAQRKR